MPLTRKEIIVCSVGLVIGVLMLGIGRWGRLKAEKEAYQAANTPLTVKGLFIGMHLEQIRRLFPQATGQEWQIDKDERAFQSKVFPSTVNMT